MNRDQLKLKAQVNMHRLMTSPYPGRGLVLGRDPSGEYLVQVYWIMGRSDDSRNRVFSQDGGRVFTELADPTKPCKNPELTLYNAMDEQRKEGTPIDKGAFVVSNGRQTDHIVQRTYDGGTTLDALKTHKYTYEPDPNSTSRISGTWYLLNNRHVGADIVVLRRSPFGETCDFATFEYDEIASGFGLCVHTYAGDDDPLPAFHGEPFLVPIAGTPEGTVKRFWKVLDEDNRVSLAVKFIPISGGPSVVHIVNKYEKVAAQ